MHGDQELWTVLAVCSVAALAALINGYVLLVILLTKRTSSPINVLLTHLSAVDLTLCVSVLVSMLSVTFNESEHVAPWLCPVHGFLFNFLHPMAIWTVCGLNCDRYYAIAAPLHYGTLVNSRKIMLGLCGTWIVCLLISMPPVFRLAPYTYQPGLPVCTADFGRGRATIIYSIFYTTITLVLPGVIILGCNIKVFTIARYHRHRIASAIFEVTLSAQVTITHQRNPFFLPTAMANKLRRSNAFSAVFQIVGSLAVFYLPYYSVCLYESLCAALGAAPRTGPAVKSLTFALITGSALCNGLLYGIKNKVLQKTYQNYRRKVMTKCEVNQEIQARTPSACGSRRPSLTPVAVNHHHHLLAQTGVAGKQQHSGAAGGGPVRRSSDMTAVAMPVISTGSANGLDFGNYYAQKRFAGDSNSAGPSSAAIRRCYSSGAGGACSLQTAFVQRIRRDSKRSPRILITRAMSEENESCASESGTPVHKDLVHKLSSSAVTLFIDERRRRRRRRRRGRRRQKGTAATAASAAVNYYYDDNGGGSDFYDDDDDDVYDYYYDDDDDEQDDRNDHDDDDDDDGGVGDYNLSATAYSSLSSSNDSDSLASRLERTSLAHFSSA